MHVLYLPIGDAIVTIGYTQSLSFAQNRAVNNAFVLPFILIFATLTVR